MPKLDCPVVESVFRPVDEVPVLSVVIPTRDRCAEMILAVSSIAEQLTGGLEKKVEIVVSDNASSPQTVEAIRALAEKFPTVSYVVNARDEGGFFQFFAAPWRARGRWTWVFGSDDALLPGGAAHIVGLLEREDPGFLGVNKRVMNRDLSQLLSTGVNSVPDRRFDGFIDMFCALGINQFAFISGNIERTELARRLDPRFYLTADTRHPHLAALVEKYHAHPSFYSSDAYLIHRAENSPMLAYHSGNFFDFGVTLPCVLTDVLQRIGLSPDLFERITADKAITSYDPPAFTYVDAMLENILRAVAFGKYMTVGHRHRLEEIFTVCREPRLGQFAEVWSLHQHLGRLDVAVSRAKTDLEEAQRAVLAGSKTFARQ